MNKEFLKDRFLELMEENGAIVHNICRIYTNNSDDYQDLYQEILMQSWKSFPGFKSRSRFSTWLYKVSLNTAITEFHRKKRHLKHMKNVSDHYNQMNQDRGREKYLEILYKAIGALNALDKAIILLYLEESSYRDMAEIIGISVSNVGVRLKRAKERLEGIIKKFEKKS
jgi:RNA polymerase sigma-70 factor (ECF subfamily)